MSAPPSLLERYEAAAGARGYTPDPAQRAVIARLERLRISLGEPVSRSFWRRWRRPAAAARGVYIHGPVGRGKTMLMDLFFESLPFAQRRRSHFHHFMRDVHARLRALSSHRSPLELVAGEWSTRCRVLCLDELFVSDIADAMILGGLFRSLLDRGVVLVMTSNASPSRLYPNGLQRSRFLPTIALLERALDVCTLDGGTDYRLQHLRQANLYLDAAAPETAARMQEIFEDLAGPHGVRRGSVELLGRQVPARAAHADVAWFEFRVLCEGARSQNDYLELAEEFRTVLISDVPRFGSPEQDDAARRLIALVDAFYDQGTKLIVSAAVPALELYSSGRLRSDFERTASRLVEMQSPAYLARERRPAGVE